MIAMFTWTFGGVLQAIFLGIILMLGIISGLYYLFINIDNWLIKRRNKKLQRGFGLSHLLKK
jgi:hypothetical protein